MTGAYLTVRRDGRWQSVEIDQLTDAELDRFIAQMEAGGGGDLGRWVKFLAAWIRDNVRDDGPADTTNNLNGDGR
jgi:hypothetical protein